MGEFKISCLSVDCPERTGGQCQWDPRGRNRTIFQVLENKPVNADGSINVTEQELERYMDALGGDTATLYKYRGRRLEVAK